MSGDVSTKKRLILITEGCLRNNLLYLSGHHDFFPKECYGPSNKRSGVANQLTLVVEGLPDKVQTDIPLEARNGNPSNSISLFVVNLHAGMN